MAEVEPPPGEITMNDHPPEIIDSPAAADPRPTAPTVEEVDTDFVGLPVESEEEIQAGLIESETDIQAGRVRPARAAILAIAARHGLRIEE
jgi:hypothetical protein